MRWFRPLPLLTLTLVACSDHGPDVAESRAAAQPSVQVESAYDQCRDKADGDASALIACAEAEIGRAGKGIDSAAAAAAFRSAIQQLGDELAGEGGQSQQVLFADRAVEVARRRARLLSGTLPDKRQPGRTLPFGDEAVMAWSQSRAISCREHSVPGCAARYDGLLVTFRDMAGI